MSDGSDVLEPPSVWASIKRNPRELFFRPLRWRRTYAWLLCTSCGLSEYRLCGKVFAFSSAFVRSRKLDGFKRSVELAVHSEAKIAALTEARWLFAMISYHFLFEAAPFSAACAACFACPESTLRTYRTLHLTESAICFWLYSRFWDDTSKIRKAFLETLPRNSSRRTDVEQSCETSMRK